MSRLRLLERWYLYGFSWLPGSHWGIYILVRWTISVRSRLFKSLILVLIALSLIEWRSIKSLFLVLSISFLFHDALICCVSACRFLKIAFILSLNLNLLLRCRLLIILIRCFILPLLLYNWRSWVCWIPSWCPLTYRLLILCSICISWLWYGTCELLSFFLLCLTKLLYLELSLSQLSFCPFQLLNSFPISFTALTFVCLQCYIFLSQYFDFSLKLI